MGWLAVLSVLTEVIETQLGLKATAECICSAAVSDILVQLKLVAVKTMARAAMSPVISTLFSIPKFHSKLRMHGFRVSARITAHFLV